MNVTLNYSASCVLLVGNCGKLGFLMVWLGECGGSPQYRIIEIPKDDKLFDDDIRHSVTYFYNEVMMKEIVDSRKARQRHTGVQR